MLIRSQSGATRRCQESATFLQEFEVTDEHTGELLRRPERGSLADQSYVRGAIRIGANRASMT